MGEPLVGAFADHEGKAGPALVAHVVDRGAVGGDDRDLAVLLPQRIRRALDEVDHEMVGIELAHARRLDQRLGLEPRARRRGVEKQQRALRIDPGLGENLRLAEIGLAGDGHDRDVEAERAGDIVAQAALAGDKRLVFAAAHRAEQGGAEQEPGGQSDADAARRGAREQARPGEDAARGALARKQHARRFDRMARIGGPRGRAKRQDFAHRPHDASSTIHETSSPKDMPACAAISGTRDVSVIPGWVLTSRQTSSSFASS